MAATALTPVSINSSGTPAVPDATNGNVVASNDGLKRWTYHNRSGASRTITVTPKATVSAGHKLEVKTYELADGDMLTLGPYPASLFGDVEIGIDSSTNVDVIVVSG